MRLTLALLPLWLAQLVLQCLGHIRRERFGPNTTGPKIAVQQVDHGHFVPQPRTEPPKGVGGFQPDVGLFIAVLGWFPAHFGLVQVEGAGGCNRCQASLGRSKQGFQGGTTKSPQRQSTYTGVAGIPRSVKYMVGVDCCLSDFWAERCNI